MATVLVVDDSATNRDVVCTLLRYGGHRVVDACDGGEALTTARRIHPDVVVTDVLMPQMDGYQLARALRADPDTAQAALVFYTANYSEQELQSVMTACGVARVVPKSGDPQQLLDTVQEVLTAPPTMPVDARTVDLDVDHAHTVNAKLIEKVRQLDTSEARFRVMAQSAPLGILILSPDGQTSYANERLLSIMGLDLEALSGLGWLQCFGSDLRDTVLAAVCEKPVRDIERRYRTRQVRLDGGIRWLNTHLRMVLDEEGRSSGAIVMVDDVTALIEADERAQTETRRRELDARLRASQRLEGLRRLAGGVAHDYNNQLAVILSFGEFVKDALGRSGRDRDESVDADTVREALADLERVLDAAHRATGLSRQLQLFGSRAVFAPTVIDLNAVIDAEAEILVELVGDEVDLDVRLNPGVHTAMADPEQVLHILRVLISNARDAMPDGGMLFIETANLQIGQRRDLDHDLAAGDYVRLTVKDTGCGMSEEVIARAIEPFFTTKARGRGQGLGLAVAFGIATQVGGDLRIESTPGAGTTVHVILPIAHATTVPARPSGPPRVDRNGTHTVLVVDDEPAVRELVARILSRAGYQVLQAGSGDEAIQIADGYADEIACLVTDVVMPRMLGSELARRLTAQRSRLAVLYMSGYADPMLEGAQGLGSEVAMLSKPFKESHLLAALHAVIHVGETS